MIRISTFLAQPIVMCLGLLALATLLAACNPGNSTGGAGY
jgi:predicted small secreted protein